jgi:hypothetical protein
MPMLDPNQVQSAVDLLVKLLPQTTFTTKHGKNIILFPPNTAIEACQALGLLSQADQTVNQKHLDMILLEKVSRVRNLYHRP